MTELTRLLIPRGSIQATSPLPFVLGADIIGVNCFWGPDVCLKAMAAIKEALEKAGLKRHLIVQPIGYKTPEFLDDSSNGEIKKGMSGLAEFPFGRFSRCLFTRKNQHFQANISEGAGPTWNGLVIQTKNKRLFNKAKSKCQKDFSNY